MRRKSTQIDADRVSPFSLKREAKVALELAQRASLATEKIRMQGVRVENKRDGSPVTQADIVSQAIILSGIRTHFPDDRVAAEEHVGEGAVSILDEVAWTALRDAGLKDPESNLKEWVNYRGNPVGRRIWMIDPIDGTEGYKSNLSYAVVIGLFYEGAPRFGCIAAPLFPLDHEGDQATAIVYGGPSIGTYRYDPEDGRSYPVHVSDRSDISSFRLAVSRVHHRSDIETVLRERAGISRVVRMDGQGKYILLTLGRADVYVHASGQRHGIGFPWDHCAGQAVLEGAGGVMTTFDGTPLHYEQEGWGAIMEVKGIVASNRVLHQELLSILREDRSK